MRKIKSLEIKNSTFFTDTKINFSDRLNCIMGGRGSGKTTLLYFIKSAVEQSAEDNNTLSKVLKANLGNGTVILEIEDGDITYRITKEINDVPQPHVLPHEEFVHIAKIDTQISCDIYEANRIEEIGRNSIDRLQLIDRKLQNGIQDQLADIRRLQIDLDSNAQDIKAFNRKLKQMKENIPLYDQIEEELETLKQRQPAGINEEDRRSFEEANKRADQRRSEKRFLSKTLQSIGEFLNSTERSKDELVNYLRDAQDDQESFDNDKIMQTALDINSKVRICVEDGIGRVKDEVLGCRKRLEEITAEIGALHETQEAEFIKLKQRFDENKDFVNQYHQLSKRISEKKVLLQEIAELEKKREGLKDVRRNLIDSLNGLKQSIFNTRLLAVRELNDEFQGHIVITLRFSGISEDFESKLKAALKGSNLKYNLLVPKIVERFTCDEFAKVIHSRDIESLKSVDGIDQQRANALIDALYESEEIYEIEAMYCHDIPEFKLKIADDSEIIEENYRKTDELSMGQRCTAVLPIIFAVSSNPLIIDQPEDNLDNKYITQRIHEIVRNQKDHRQMIFITHNPNIPVLSDAENNLFLLYEDRKSKVDAQGTVDEVKEKIVTLLEGGKEAFNKRVEIYGDSLR